jgi:predicted nuclease of restriction endonuclease-like RecB superfamily
MTSLLSVLPWCGRFSLRAECVVRGVAAQLELSSGAPIFPGERPRPFDSKLEERFTRDFLAAAPDWDVVREPEPVRAGSTLVFPDFRLQHRLDPTRSALVEIVGFWTPEYLERKLAKLREAGLTNLILCIDEQRQCGDGELPKGARVIRYRRRIDPHAVLAALDPAGATAC